MRSANNEELVINLILYGILLLLIIFAPLVTIWSLNTLFLFAIPYSFKSWAAIIWLFGMLHGIRLTFNRTSN